jgi:hypothetical protein
MDALQNWFFWTWKIGNSTELGYAPSPFWHYKLGLEQGWIPADPRSAGGYCGRALSIGGAQVCLFTLVSNPVTDEPVQRELPGICHRCRSQPDHCRRSDCLTRSLAPSINGSFIHRLADLSVPDTHADRNADHITRALKQGNWARGRMVQQGGYQGSLGNGSGLFLPRVSIAHHACQC